MSLEDKLKEILEECVKVNFGYGVNVGHTAQATEEITQAFKDDGWIRINVSRATHGRNQEGSRIPALMTGQEWYDRFEKELKARGKIVDWLTPFAVKQAAKKASGL